MKKALRTIPLLVALLAATALPAFAGSKAKAVPFTGTGIAIPTVLVPGPPTQVGNALKGNATHLGKFTGTSLAVASVVNGVLHAEGNQQITAGDGSTLTLFITGDFPAGFSGPVANGTYLIVSGTGRFAGASGSGVFTGAAVTNGVRPIGYAGVIIK